MNKSSRIPAECFYIPLRPTTITSGQGTATIRAVNANPPLSPGIYVDLVPSDRGDLRLILTTEGRAETETFRIEQSRHGTWAALVCLLGDHLEGAWELFDPLEFAGLTWAPILGTGIHRDDQGQLLTVKHLYWFPDYSIRDEVEELLDHGEIIFDRAPSETDADQPYIVTGHL